MSWIAFLFLDAASLSGVCIAEREKSRRQRLGLSSRENMLLDFAVEKHIVGNSVFLGAAFSKVFLSL